MGVGLWIAGATAVVLLGGLFGGRIRAPGEDVGAMEAASASP